VSAKYLELYEEIKRDIVLGIYKTGEKLPSKRVLAQDRGVSVITVEHTYSLLAEEGYIEARERSGYVVLFSEGDYFTGALPKKKVVKDEEILPVTSGKSEADDRLFPTSIYAKTVRRVLSEKEERLMEKAPSFGEAGLRRTLADYLLRSRHIRVTPKQILIGAGAEYLYGMIVRALGEERIYGVEAPGYHRIEEVYRSAGARVEMLPLGNDGIKSKALQKSNADVLHITPYRSFPTGVTATLQKKMEYLKWSKNREGIIIEDDFESEFTPHRKAEDTLFSMDREGRVIYVNTFTRTIGPSIRIAYMLIPDSLIDLFEEKIGFYACPVPMLEQLVVGELIENGDFERHINRVRRRNRSKE
jgi:GntR family transcriptional regulator/MocR family aminotransferase